MLSGRTLALLVRCMKLWTPQKRVRLTYTSSGFTSPREIVTKQIKFICGDETFTGTGKIEEDILDVVLNNDIPLDGFGACEGMLACSTCHVILEKDHFERVDRINPPSQDELDLLDLAPGLSEYSRLGCQIQLARDDPDTIVCVVPVHEDLRLK